MSIAFVALILGFLLGKFTSDRNHIIKESIRRKSELSHRTVVPQNEVDRMIDFVNEGAQFKLTTNFKDQLDSEQVAKKYTNNLRSNFSTCICQNNFDASTDDLAEFLSNLLRYHYKNYLKCTKDLHNDLVSND